jgi:hypothetical protein
MALLAGPLSFLPFFIQDRYLAGALIPALVWIGEGTAWLGGWLTRTWRAVADGRLVSKVTAFGFPLSAIPALLLAIILLWQQPRLWATLHWTHSFQPGHLAAAEVLRAGVPADVVVMSRYPAIAFHAGTRWAPTPAAEWPQVLAYARAHRAGYLVVDEWEVGRLRPQLQFLLDPAQAPPELCHLRTLQSDGGVVLVYALRDLGEAHFAEGNDTDG